MTIETKETYGICESCGKRCILGNGYCQECWDEEKNIKLTPRESEVLIMIAEGASNSAIAERMVLSINTIEMHIRNIFSKIYVPGWAFKRTWLAVNADRFLNGNGNG